MITPFTDTKFLQSTVVPSVRKLPIISRPENVCDLHDYITKLIAENRNKYYWALTVAERVNFYFEDTSFPIEADVEFERELINIVRQKLEKLPKHLRFSLGESFYFQDIHDLAGQLEKYISENVQITLPEVNSKLAFYVQKPNDSFTTFFVNVRLAIKDKTKLMPYQLTMNGNAERVIAGILDQRLVAKIAKKLKKFYANNFRKSRTLETFLLFAQEVIDKAKSVDFPTPKDIEIQNQKIREEFKSFLGLKPVDTIKFDESYFLTEESEPEFEEDESEAEYWQERLNPGAAGVDVSDDAEADSQDVSDGEPIEGEYDDDGDDDGYDDGYDDDGYEEDGYDDDYDDDDECVEEGEVEVQEESSGTTASIGLGELHYDKEESDVLSMAALYELHMLKERNFYTVENGTPQLNLIQNFYTDSNNDNCVYRHTVKLSVTKESQRCEVEIDQARMAISLALEAGASHVVKFLLTDMKLNQPVYVKPPAHSVEYVSKQDNVYKFIKPIPGMNPCPEKLAHKVKEHLESLNFKCVDVGIFVRSIPIVTVVLYAYDEMLVLSEAQSGIQKLQDEISPKVNIVNSGFINAFLGVKLQRTPKNGVKLISNEFESKFSNIELKKTPVEGMVDGAELMQIQVMKKFNFNIQEEYCKALGLDYELQKPVPANLLPEVCSAIEQICYQAKSMRPDYAVIASTLSRSFSDLRMIHYRVLQRAITFFVNNKITCVNNYKHRAQPIITSKMHVRYTKSDPEANMGFFVKLNGVMVAWSSFTKRTESQGTTRTLSDMQLICSSIALSYVAEMQRLAGSLLLGEHTLELGFYPENFKVPELPSNT